MVDLTKGSILKKVLLVAFPVLLSSIAQMAYNLTDLFWIGRVDSIGLNESAAISGIGTAGYVTWFAFGLILIAKIGTSVKVAHAAGAKNQESIDRYASNGIAVAVGLGIAFSVIVFLLRQPIIAIFAITDPVVVANAISYLSIVGGLLIFQFASSGFAAVNEGLGKTITNFFVMGVGLALNMILDPLFILTFRLGVAGAAWATIIAQAATFLVYLLMYRFNQKKGYRLATGLIDRKTIGEVVRIGVPAGLQSMFFTSISIIIARLIFAWFGKDVMAAQRLGSQIEQFTWMIGGGFQTALTVFVGQNFGAGQLGRIRRGTIGIAAILLPYSAIITFLFAFRAEFFIRLFIDDPVTVAYGTEYLAIISFAQMFMMLEGIGAGLFNGVGKTKIPSIAGIIGNVMRIPLAYLLVASFAQTGIWWALNLSDALKGGFLMIAGIFLLFRLEKTLATRKKASPEMPLLVSV
ncbi:MAG: MATE family efflux transporter [bacterium]